MSAWTENAECRGQTSRFFLEAFAPLAKATCERCQVRPQCQESGLHEPWGVWGGLDAAERRRVREKRKRRLAA